MLVQLHCSSTLPTLPTTCDSFTAACQFDKGNLVPAKTRVQDQQNKIGKIRTVSNATPVKVFIQGKAMLLQLTWHQAA
jgi:hypothetical protein